MSYYKNKIPVLKKLFGDDIVLNDRSIIIKSNTYQIIDDVIILSKFKTDELIKNSVVESFGFEWKEFHKIYKSHYNEFNLYFDKVNLEKLKNSIVMDLGCGIGRWSYILSEKISLKNIILSDYSDSIFIARKNLKKFDNAIYLKLDLENNIIEKNSVDFGFCLGVLHHLPKNLHQRDVALKNISSWMSETLFYLYYNFDNRGRLFKKIYGFSNIIRLNLIKIKNLKTRSNLSHLLTIFAYFPFIFINRLLKIFHISIIKMPLYFYTSMTYSRVRQDAYDKFFTPVEYRYSKKELNVIFKRYYKNFLFSDIIPKWHFIAAKKEINFSKTEINTKKILLVTQSYSGGGAQKIIKELTKIKDKHLIVKYLCIEKNLDEIDNENIVFTNTLKLRDSFGATSRFINEFKPDIVMSTITNVDFFIFLIKFFSKQKFKHIIRLSVVMTEHYRTFYLFLIYKIFIKFLYKSTHTFVCMSNDMLIDLNKNFNIDKKKIIKIPNFTKMNLVKKQAIFSEVNNFICIGRIHPQKGYDILINAVSKNNNKNFKIKIYGYGNDNLQAEYQKMINEKNLNKYISFEGKLTDMTIINKFDALILPSRYEGFPNVALEAMSFGLPVLALPFKGGINEIVDNDVNGRIAKNMCAKSLCEILEKFNKDDYNASDIVKSITQFDEKIILKKYIELFINV